MKTAKAGLILILSWFFFISCSHGVAADTRNEKVSPTPAAALPKDSGIISVINGESFSYCSLPMKGPLEQQGQAFFALLEELKKQGVQPEGFVPFTILWDDPDTSPPERLEWEAGVVLASGQTVMKPLERHDWNFRMLATVHYEGIFSPETQKQSAQRLKKWIKENGYALIGPPMLKYPVPPQTDKDGRLTGKIEYLFPIGKGQ